MSGIAGIIHFDGAPVESGLIEKMTAAMHKRGPDGIQHWQNGSAALGQCMFRTTPESLEEVQPWCNEDESLVLVLDGRVDNYIELRKDLLANNLILRNISDAELVLRSYELWGEECLDKIIGEFTFFIWNAREQHLFAGRDVAGTRHFYYYEGEGWFAFASEIKGLLTLKSIKPVLNETRLLDYLIVEYDRDDEVGTFYQGINRMPAGHAMRVSKKEVKVWRYWDPSNLPPLQFISMEECAQAFLEQLRIAVKCRLRSIGPVGAALSGGLDSSSIVGLIRKEFQSELEQPLRTISLVCDNREKCLDSKYIAEMLKDGWLEPTIITSALSRETCQSYIDSISDLDEPFALGWGLSHILVYEAANDKGCRVLLDGLAGDLHFYSLDRSLSIILNQGIYSKIPSIVYAYYRHGFFMYGLNILARRGFRNLIPHFWLDMYRKHRVRTEILAEDIKLLNYNLAEQYLAAKNVQRTQKEASINQCSDQSAHAARYLTGTISAPHEVCAQVALNLGVEPRSPFSDRRIIEFAIRMPLEAKLSASWYKKLLRKCMTGILPEKLVWRHDLNGHPGREFYERLISVASQHRHSLWNQADSSDTMASIVEILNFGKAKVKFDSSNARITGQHIFAHDILSKWISSHTTHIE